MSEQSAVSGEVADTSQNQDKGAVTLAEFSPEQNAAIDKLLARKEKEWEKKNKDAFTKASEFDKLQKQLTEKEQAELTENERLKRQLAELQPVSEKAKAYEEFIAKQFEELSSELSEEDKETLEALSVSITEKIALAKRLIVKAPQVQNGPARAGNPASKGSDQLLEKVKQEAEIYCKGKTDEYKQKFIENRYATLKAGADGQKFAGLE